MPRWWDKIRKAFSGKPQASKQEPARWLSVEDSDNPFDVPILDLMVTQTFVATSGDPEVAERSVSWARNLGDGFDTQALLQLEPIDCAIELPAAPDLPNGLLYTPRSMDVKWVIAWRDGHIIAARSWTGAVEAVAEATHRGQTMTVHKIYVNEDSALNSGDVGHAFDWLLRCHALDQKLPFPADESTTGMLAEIPSVAFSLFGNVIFCAAHDWNPGPAKVPLRSDGRIISAVQDDDLQAVAAAVRAGERIDAESTCVGYSALHLAIVRKNLELYEHLVDLGAGPAKLADRQTHALHLACVHKAPLELFDAIGRSELELGLPNDDGFTALHAASEVDYADAIPWLASNGLLLETTTNRGHTALHLAAALGHVATARALLAAGANPLAHSAEGTPLDIARSEGKDETIALLSSL